jgi:16S rRNA processing protein RimM
MPEARIQLGVIGRAHGVRGLVKVTSHTADPADLTAYGPLSDAAGRLLSLRWKADGIAEISRIVDGVAVKVTDRSEAEKLTNTRLFVDRSALPPVDEEEYYLADLIGLAVTDQAGARIGTVSVVHDYGAGASLEIERGSAAPLLVPFTAACVPTVDIHGGRLVVVPPDEVAVAPDADVPHDAHPVVPHDAHPVALRDRDQIRMNEPPRTEEEAA